MASWFGISCEIIVVYVVHYVKFHGNFENSWKEFGLCIEMLGLKMGDKNKKSIQNLLFCPSHWLDDPNANSSWSAKGLCSVYWRSAPLAWRCLCPCYKLVLTFQVLWSILVWLLAQSSHLQDHFQLPEKIAKIVSLSCSFHIWHTLSSETMYKWFKFLVVNCNLTNFLFSSILTSWICHPSTSKRLDVNPIQST